MSVLRSTLVLLVAGLCLAFSASAEAMLYWGNGSQIERMNFDGSYRSNVPAFSRFYPGVYIQVSGEVCGLAVDATHIFWGIRSSNAIGRANLDGSEANQAFVTGANEPCGVAVDGSHLYWANLGGSTIGRADLDGTTVEQGFVDAGPRPCGVAVDASHVYWGRGTESALGRADLDGGGVVPDFIPTVARDCGITVDATHIFWTDFLGLVGRANVDGSGVEPKFIGGLDRPCGIALSGSQLYWSNESVGAGAIGRSSVDGAVVDRGFLPDSGRSCSIAADSTYYVPPPVPASSIRLGRSRRNLAKGIALIPVFVPDTGQFKVTVTNGLSWRFVGEGVGPALSGGGRKWLRIWPSPTGWDGHNLRRQLRSKGRIRVKVSITYSEIEKAPTTRTRSLVLVRKQRAKA